MPKQAEKATNWKVTGKKIIRLRIRDAERVRQGRKQVLLTPDASSWVRMIFYFYYYLFIYLPYEDKNENE